MYTYTDKGL